jgi:peptidoglycan hydrolase-like amidase
VIGRRYSGMLDIRSEGRLVIPVVTMDCETATRSIVEAELPTSACPAQALAAQAVVSRSILCAATEPRHRFADFCDTTHCQFLRSPAVPGSKTSQAVDATNELVLYDRGSILPARYSAACGGITDAVLDGNHQYVPVACEICRKQRIARRGHGIGLCQEGAMGLARLGWTWQAILAKFYPNATIGSGSRRLAAAPLREARRFSADIV